MDTSERKTIRFRMKQASHYTLPIVIIMIGIVLSVALYIIVLDKEHQRIRTEFEQDAEERFEALKREIESDLHVLDSINAFYTHDYKIGRPQFRDFVKHFLSRHPSIQALEWIPRIPHNQREAYEKAAKQDGFPNFQITDRKTQGKMVRAPQRNEYFPVYFVEPYKGNEMALGFDLGSNQTRLEALERSRDTGELVATARIKLVQEKAGQFGFLVFEPIYRKDGLSGSVESRREKLEGFALGVFRIGDIIEKSASYLTAKEIDFYLYDESAPMEERFLYFHRSRASNAAVMSKRSEETKSETGFQYARTLDVAGRKWKVLYRPLPEYIAAKKTWQPVGVLLIGLLFTAFLGSYLLINVNRTERIQRLVKERTGELQKTNDALSHEIVIREQAEQALQKSEAEARRLAQENAIMAQIGRVVSSTLNIEEVYERFAEEVRKLIPFDSIAINMINDVEGTITVPYVSGISGLGCQPGEMLPLAGSVTGEVMRTRSGLIIQTEDRDKLQTQFPTLVAAWDAGLRSLIVVPLISRDRVIGAIHFRSVKSNTYSDQDRKLAESIGSQVAGAVANATLFAERKQAEEALKESENKYRKIFENVQDVFYQTDKEGNIIDISPSIERYSGYAREELIGKPVGEVYFNPEDRVRLLETIREKGEVIDYELRLKSKDNRLIYTSANAHILFDPSGKPIGVEGTLRDITERKRAEDELQKLAAVVRYSSELIGLATPDGKMVFLNEAGSKMLGISPAEIEQTNIMQVIPDHLKEKVQNELLPALMNHGTWEGDLQYLNLKTRQLTDVHAMTFMIKDAVTGAPLFLANVSLDITEQKELETALHKAKEEAERANRAKTIFLANMSHEIRTPMNAILGFSQLMQRDPAVTPRQRQQLNTINRSGEHLLALINDILEISKIEAGRITLNPTAFDLNALLNDLEMMFRLRTDAKNLQFSMERIGEVPRFVVGDEGKLREVLINLLGNAVKFTKKGGIILCIRARQEETKGLRLLAEVEDTGPGMTAEDMGRMFHHFEQAQAGREAGIGTGLGLAISRGFVRLMGGDITVSSQVGKGSLFAFDIALQEADPAAVVVKAESRHVTGLQPGQPRYRVLVADDKEDNRELLSQMLAPVGFQIRQVADGEDTIKEFEMWNPSLILMDLRMPVVDGYEAIRRIRAGARGKDAKIIAVTASAFEETREEVLATGADDFVSKPFREIELFEKIGRLLGVKYVYAEEAVSAAFKPEASEALTSKSLIGLPGGLLRQIREATINADLDRVLELIQQAATHDIHVANGMRSLAERFDYQKLLDLIPTEGAKNGTENHS